MFTLFDQRLPPVFPYTFFCRLKDCFPGKVYARIEWTYWFHKVLYYQVALVYVLTRLVTNVSQVSRHLHFVSYYRYSSFAS